MEVYQNTFINCPASFERTPRSAEADHFGWHPATGPDVDERFGHAFANNLLIAEADYSQPFLRCEQRPELCGLLTEPQADRVDHNGYVRLSRAPVAVPLITWSPTENADECAAGYDSVEAFRTAQAGFGEGSEFFGAYPGPVVQSLMLQRYALEPGFPGATVSGPVPAEALEAWDREQVPGFPGAFAPQSGRQSRP